MNEIPSDFIGRTSATINMLNERIDREVDAIFAALKTMPSKDDDRPANLNDVCKGLRGKIIAISDTVIARVTKVEMGLITAVDTGGAVYKIDYKQLGYGRKRKRAILFHLYGEKCLRCGAVTERPGTNGALLATLKTYRYFA